jgi:hypothetical protein
MPNREPPMSKSFSTFALWVTRLTFPPLKHGFKTL